MSAKIRKKSAYAKALGKKGRIDLTAIQYFTTPQWEAWIIDRLQGHDLLVPFDPRQGEDPEFLFIDLMLQLGKARETAEYAIENVLNLALQTHWEDAPLASLFYMVERLHVNNCIPALLRYLDAPFKMSVLPLARALVALAQFDKGYPVTFEDWWKWTEHAQDDLLPECFSSLIDINPDMAIRLLGTAEWTEWQDSTLVEALLDELEIHFLSTRPDEPTMAGLGNLTHFCPEFREAMFSILPADGNINGWSRDLFPVFRRPTTFWGGDVNKTGNESNSSLMGVRSV